VALPTAAELLERTVAAVLRGYRLLTIAIMVWIAGVLVLSVALRLLLNWSLTWVGEACSLLLVWLMLSVAPLGFHEHFHIAIDLVGKRASPRLRRSLGVLTTLCTAAFFAIAGYFGLLSTISEFQVRLVSLPITRGWFMLMLPVSSAAVLLVCLGNLCKLGSRADSASRPGSPPS
jgi:TRAP-type C4-dicarboxylate transport system permease small subunit